ncbi:hypothetical protein LB522_18360 [Mesorhizobium sp. CA9]|uniref:hypothetical protein n=1 Tax=unclassified Mesorhizobium TaxID=325217 RepID=UPI001CCD3F52|nr:MULTISPECIES: hypothetical protein [unclassified Mesorhizobium]MBZ9735354.1 hypothetical protein [Mesorhizobium sp. CA9]MBZ9769290.1 hypothetical protein [Mesorhizobium sp. CA6]MBZ9878744.1 hypothetical protein [Mesorhizobium sp. Ca11]MBZ9912883.1 hypothetical protein [Mesorhizobium sp. CA16]
MGSTINPVQALRRLTIMVTVQEKLVSTPAQGWFFTLLREFARFSGRRRGYLDVREFSEHLQRDMGFLDGNDPRGRSQ